MKTATENRKTRLSSERGMTLIAVMAMMVLFAMALLAVAPTVHQEVQREKELESIRRGEEVANAIRIYVDFHQGAKLPESIDDLLEGIPQGTKKRMILRPSAATDPLSADGKWRLIKAEPDTISAFAKRVQSFNNGLLPTNPSGHLDRYSIQLLVNLNTGTEDDTEQPFEDYEVVTDNQPFIGVASQSRNKSLITYYGIEKHSNWIFTPLFRGSGTRTPGQAQPIPVRPAREPRPPGF
ncbi:MAG TPA: type II secretion system protein [Pyrinomonadaceae bacterium]|nr:type II secretion system protein [Pyrinomonadaceae bacterium]